MSEKDTPPAEGSVSLEEIFADLDLELGGTARAGERPVSVSPDPAPVESEGGETPGQQILREIRERANRAVGTSYVRPAVAPAPAEVNMRPGIARFVGSRRGERRPTMVPIITMPDEAQGPEKRKK